jgi:hypothetical protein
MLQMPLDSVSLDRPAAPVRQALRCVSGCANRPLMRWRLMNCRFSNQRLRSQSRTRSCSWPHMRMIWTLRRLVGSELHTSSAFQTAMAQSLLSSDLIRFHHSLRDSVRFRCSAIAHSVLPDHLHDCAIVAGRSSTTLLSIRQQLTRQQGATLAMRSDAPRSHGRKLLSVLTTSARTSSSWHACLAPGQLRTRLLVLQNNGQIQQKLFYRIKPQS